MEYWKRALLAGSAGASAILFLKRKQAAGVFFAGVSLATLASEYPHKFAEIRRNLPYYIERGTDLLDVASRVGERLAELAESRASAWRDSRLRG